MNPTKNYHYFLAAALILLIISAFFLLKNRSEIGERLSQPERTLILEESSDMLSSKSPDWWLNSGGVMQFFGPEFQTNFGELPENSSWKKLYAKSNSKDTDGGYHPQNIFRLVTKSQWKNLDQSVYFYIDKINLSESSNRNQSNGVLLFNRYRDGDNLYYTGVRVDGHAVIKKKIDGEYFTLAEKKIMSGKEYDSQNNFNALPLKRWMGIKSEVTNIGPETVNIKLFFDQGGRGEWKQILEITDEGDDDSSSTITDKGYAGIRTDFMDVKFKDYKIKEK